MKQILVVEREYGAGGSSIAARMAERLGWKLYDHALTEEIAALAKVNPDMCRKHEERVDPFLYRLAKVFWRGSHERSAHLADSDVLDADRLICLTEEVLKKLTVEGRCVIVGRAAAWFLRNRPDTFCVFLYASRDAKFQRVLAEVKNEAEAIELVDTVDNERRDFIKHYFDAEWPSRHLYHAMLNTAMGDEATVDTLLQLMADANRREEAVKS
jgi:cytidylate kinase